LNATREFSESCSLGGQHLEDCMGDAFMFVRRNGD
jgi:hypothetical protein